MCGFDGSELDPMSDDVERDVPEPDYYTVVWTGRYTGNDIQSRLLFTDREAAEKFAADDEKGNLTNGRVIPLAIIPF